MPYLFQLKLLSLFDFKKLLKSFSKLDWVYGILFRLLVITFTHKDVSVKNSFIYCLVILCITPYCSGKNNLFFTTSHFSFLSPMCIETGSGLIF